MFLQIVPSYNSFLLNLKNRRYAYSRKFRIFYSNSFYLEDTDLGSPKLHTIEIFNQTNSHKNLVILAFMGAELVPPLPGRVILNPIPGCGLNSATVHHGCAILVKIALFHMLELHFYVELQMSKFLEKTIMYSMN